MTARDTYNATVTSAALTKAATLTLNEMTRQVTIDAKKSVIGYTLQTGNTANLLAAVASGNAAKIANDTAAEITRQGAVMVAADTLKNSGDKGPT